MSKRKGNDSKISKVLDELKEKSKDVLYYSEAEYPMEVFSVKQLRHETLEETIRHGYKHKLPTLVHISNLSIDDNQEPEESEEDKKWNLLLAVLGNNLSDLKVARFGDEPEIKVFFVGTLDGWLIGLSTTSIET
jgi:hypothetical protein